MKTAYATHDQRFLSDIYVQERLDEFLGNMARASREKSI